MKIDYLKLSDQMSYKMFEIPAVLFFLPTYYGVLFEQVNKKKTRISRATPMLVTIATVERFLMFHATVKMFLRCSTSPPGVNQVDGLPPVLNTYIPTSRLPRWNQC